MQRIEVKDNAQVYSKKVHGFTSDQDTLCQAAVYSLGLSSPNSIPIYTIIFLGIENPLLARTWNETNHDL